MNKIKTMDKIKLLDSIINNLEKSKEVIDGNDIDNLKAHSNELKIGLGIIKDNKNYHGKDILWDNINEQ